MMGRVGINLNRTMVPKKEYKLNKNNHILVDLFRSKN